VRPTAGLSQATTQVCDAADQAVRSGGTLSAETVARAQLTGVPTAVRDAVNDYNNLLATHTRKPPADGPSSLQAILDACIAAGWRRVTSTRPAVPTGKPTPTSTITAKRAATTKATRR
jgi:hypothetical protein